MTTGQISRLIAAVLTGLLAGAVGAAAPAQLAQRTFDLPANRLFQFVLAAPDTAWELRKVNESIRFAEAREILTGGRLRVEVDSLGDRSARIRLTASNNSDKSRKAIAAMLADLQRRIDEHQRFGAIGFTDIVTPDEVRQMVDWSRTYPPLLKGYRIGPYEAPTSSRAKTPRTMLTILTPYLRMALAARTAGQSLKPLVAETLSAEMIAPQVQVLAEPYDLGERFHPLFRYREPEHIVLLPRGTDDVSQAVQPQWSALRLSEWPEVFESRTAKVLIAAFRPKDFKPGMLFAVIYRDPNGGERKEERIPISERQLLLWNIPVE